MLRYQRAVTRAANRPRTMAARAAALVIALHSREGACYLTREQLADEIGAGLKVTRRAVQELKRSGWLAEEATKGAPKFILTRPEGSSDLQGKEPGSDRAWGRPPSPDLQGDGAQICKGMEPGSARGTPSRRPPEKTPEDLPHQKVDPGSSKKLIPPAPESPRATPGPSTPRGEVLPLPGFEVPPAAPIDPLQAAEVSEVLEHWRSRGYHTRKPIDNAERRKRIRARLDDGLDVATLKAAIDGASIDDWLMGRHERNDVANGGKVYNGLETILRDAAQVEKLATLWDVALAENRVHEDGGDRHYDRFGQPRSGKRFVAPEDPPEAGNAEVVGVEEAARRFAAINREYEERKRAEQELERSKMLELMNTGTPEIVAENRMLVEIAERAKARLARQGFH